MVRWHASRCSGLHEYPDDLETLLRQWRSCRASSDDRLYSDHPVAGDVLARFEALMVRVAAIVGPKVGYWSLIEEEDPDNVFRATPITRSIRARAEALAPKP